MDIVALISSLVEQSAAVGLAIFAIWMLNRVWQAKQAAADHYAEQLKELYRSAQKAIDRNTEALTRLCERFNVSQGE